MERPRLLAASGIAAGALLVLTACSGGAAPGSSAPPASAAAATSPSAQAGAGGSACGLAPAAALEAVVGDDPGAGKAEEGRIDGGQCTWTLSDTHSAILQLTRQPDVYLPDSVWKRPDSAADVAGVDRGWAAAETHTILVVKDGRGVLFNDIGFGKGSGSSDQAAYDALAEAIAAHL